MSSTGTFTSSLEGQKFQDTFTKINYNLNTSHPLIPNSQEYIYFKKFISIHSEDRDIIRFPNSDEFEIELPEDLLNTASVRLVQWTFPANYNTFAAYNGNTFIAFKINNPYNPGENHVSDVYNQRIFEALFYTEELPFEVFIEEGFYNPLQMATELTNKFNAAVTARLAAYFQKQIDENPNDDWETTLTQFKANGGYTRFIIVYNNVSLKLWFGNSADGFLILNEIGILTNIFLDNLCYNGRSHVPDATNYGLPSYLGLPRCNTNSISSFDTTGGININLISNASTYNGTIVPRFYYGDVTAGDNGYWLIPLDLSGCGVHWVEAPTKLNIMGEAFIYMEIAGMNCIDETQPFNFSRSNIDSNQTNGVVNSAFAKMGVPTTPLSQWFDRDSVPYKLFYPPAERIRRLRIKLRYHNGQGVNFGSFNYSFMLEFTLMVPQILRESRSTVYPPTGR